jgi:hypothetical protein
MPRRPSKPVGPRPAAKSARRRKGGGRSVKYSPEVVQDICERIARGEIWSRIGGSEGLPDYSTLYDWRDRHPEFAEAYARARAIAKQVCVDEVLAVAKDATRETVQQDRLHIGSLKWQVARADGIEAKESGWSLSKNQRLVIEVRKFERAWRADGTPYVREIGAPDDKDGGA